MQGSQNGLASRQWHMNKGQRSLHTEHGTEHKDSIAVCRHVASSHQQGSSMMAITSVTLVSLGLGRG
jgi:hypothetical protein